MRLLPVLVAAILVSAAFGDTLKLRSGRVVNGNYLGGNARQIRMEVGDSIESFDVGEVASVEFAAPAAAAPASRPAAPAREQRILRPEPTSTPAPAPAQSAANVELPAGTNLVIRMIDAVNSEQARVGQTFQASMDEPVVIQGQTVVPRGADVVVKLVDTKESGKLAGRAELALDIVSIKVNDRMVDINTQAVTRASESRTGKTAKMATGGAALGAIIGAIAGGGRGAAIGAASGAGAGTAVQVVTHGEKVHIPSETRLTFVLDTAVRI